MRCFPENVAWLSEALVVFGSAFYSARFDAIGSVRELVFGDVEEHESVDFRPIERTKQGAGQDGSPLVEGGYSALET